MKVLLYSLFAAAALSSCNAVTDPAPADPLLPSGMMQVVESIYESPQNVVFTEILAGKIWNAELESRAMKYNLILSPKNVKVAYRLAATDVPDSLKNLIAKSGLTGGTFANWKEETYNTIPDTSFNYIHRYLADYTWKGQPYLLKWSSAVRGQRIGYDISMLPGISNFTTLESGDLPDAIPQYLQRKGLQFSWANVLTDARDSKMYQIYIRVDRAYYPLFFSGDGQLIAGSDQPLWINDTRDYPENITAFISNANANNDFAFEGKIDRLVANEMDGIKSYHVTVNEVNEMPGKLQSWIIVFDANAKPLFRNYVSTVF
ncbi:MAG: hypothetical protein ACO1N1_17595 [Dyadobacter fermentans]